MSAIVRIVSRNVVLLLGAMLSATTAGVCAAANAPVTQAPAAAIAAQQSAPELEVLDEIWVRGKRLSEVIVNAEDKFFARYNKLNKDDQYDVYCGMMSLTSAGMAMVRKCVPGFIVYNSYDVRTNTVAFGEGCSDQGTMTADDYTGGYIREFSEVPTCSGYSSPPSGLLMMEKRPAYARNVLKVVGSDPSLREMAKSLRGLYDEMESVQQRYVKVRNVDKLAHPDRKPATPYAGPRVL